MWSIDRADGEPSAPHPGGSHRKLAEQSASGTVVPIIRLSFIHPCRHLYITSANTLQLSAVHALVDEWGGGAVSYFPSFEILIDELR